MTQDEIIRMMKEAGFYIGKDDEFEPAWERFAALVAAHEREKQAEQEPFDMNDHPPHRLCECRKCMEYFTPLPDCDAFAAFGKPIIEPVTQSPAYCTYPHCDCINGTLCRAKNAAPVQQAEQEPVVFYRCNGCGHAYESFAPSSCDCMEGQDFSRIEYYASPVRTKDLTDEEIEDAVGWTMTEQSILDCRAVIAAYKEKNK